MPRCIRLRTIAITPNKTVNAYCLSVQQPVVEVRSIHRLEWLESSREKSVDNNVVICVAETAATDNRVKDIHPHLGSTVRVVLWGVTHASDLQVRFRGCQDGARCVDLIGSQNTRDETSRVLKGRTTISNAPGIAEEAIRALTSTFGATVSFQVCNKPRFSSVAPMLSTRVPGPERGPPPKIFVRNERSGLVSYRPVLQQRPLQRGRNGTSGHEKCALFRWWRTALVGKDKFYKQRGRWTPIKTHRW